MNEAQPSVVGFDLRVGRYGQCGWCEVRHVLHRFAEHIHARILPVRPHVNLTASVTEHYPLSTRRDVHALHKLASIHLREAASSE